MDKLKWEKDRQTKICFFDLDGILNYYPQTWIDFVNEKYGTSWDDLFLMKKNMGYQAYKDAKEEYRTCGYKETLKPRQGIDILFDNLKHNGYYIVIITSRPVHKYPQLNQQTIHWLDRNAPQYDEVIFEDKKFIPIMSKYPFLKFGVEDNRYYANLVGMWGYKVFLLDTK